MTKDKKRYLRRDVIQRHLWIIKKVQLSNGCFLGGRLNNLTLVVRLYERQFYGRELKYE